jgi:hypothetical protein
LEGLGVDEKKWLDEKKIKVVVNIIGRQRPEWRMKRRGRTQAQWGNQSHRSIEHEQHI